MTKSEAIKIAVQVANALLQTIIEAGAQGAPANALYLACQRANISHNTYQQIMNALVSAGKVKCCNHVYYAVA